MPKRNRRLPLLALLCLALALVCVAALLIWLNIGSSGDEEKKQKSGEGRSSKSRAEEHSSADTANETSGSANANTATSTPFGTPSMESEAQEQTLLSDEEAFSSGPSPLSESGQSQHVPVCAHPSPELLAETPNCQETPAISAPVGPWLEGQQPQDLLRVFEYGLNISVQPLGQSLHAQLSMLAELSEESAVLALHCGRELGAISESEVRVWHCQSGSFVCVRSLTRLLDRQLLLVELAQPMVAGALLRLQFLHLRVPLLASAALLVQIPSPWEKDRAWLLASQFPQAGGVRALFPAVDWPQGRAVFRLCLTHAADTTARANTRAAAPGRELPGTGQVETCFKETPSLPPAQLAFALFRNLRPVPSANQNTKTELFIGSHLQPEDYGWALEETEATMRRMAELTGVQYPVDRLTLISSPLVATNDAVGGLGLVQIRDSWIEYPKFVHTHSLVVGQVVRQWTANLLSLCDQCLQGGISLFLEWLLASEFGPVEDKAAEFRRRVGEARQRLMGSEHRANPMECAERAAFVLQMLDRTFGRPTSSQFLNLLFRRHTWDAKCTSTATLSRLYLEASQKPQAQRVFDSFLPSSSSNSSTAAISNSSSSIPLLQVRVQPQSSLLFLAQMGTDSGQPLPWIPVEFVDDTGRSTQLMLNSSELAVPLVISSFLIAQPSSFARFVYNVENYMRLADCLGRAQTGGCPFVDIITLKEAINDLCWALVHRKLIVKTEAEVPQWRQLFQSLAGRVAVHGDCACCMMPESEALQGHCRWTWLDKCTRIEAPGLH